MGIDDCGDTLGLSGGFHVLCGCNDVKPIVICLVCSGVRLRSSVTRECSFKFQVWLGKLCREMGIDDCGDTLGFSGWFLMLCGCNDVKPIVICLVCCEVRLDCAVSRECSFELQE